MGRFLIHDSSTNGTYLIHGGFSPEFIRRESFLYTISNEPVVTTHYERAIEEHGLRKHGMQKNHRTAFLYRVPLRAGRGYWRCLQGTWVSL